MKRFMSICKMEMLLFMRDFFGFFFTFVFPAMMLILFGSIYGNEPVYPGSAVRYMDVTVPAYSVMIMAVTGLMSFPLTLAECKEKKIYKRYDATPVGKRTILLAQTAVNVAMTLLGLLLLVLAGKLLYQIRIQGSPAAVAAAFVLSMATMFSMGFFFTAVGGNVKITNLLCYVSYFVMLFLSGATVPDFLFPDKMRSVARLLPMTHAVDLMQAAFGGEPLGQHMTQVAVLGGLTVFFVAAGALLYRRKDW